MAGVMRMLCDALAPRICCYGDGMLARCDGRMGVCVASVGRGAREGGVLVKGVWVGLGVGFEGGRPWTRSEVV